MKKIMSFGLALCLLLSCTVSAWAATPITDYTLEKKLKLQTENSGVEGEVTFFAEGDQFLTVDEAVWTLVKNLLPSVKLVMSSTVKLRTPQRESLLQIEKDGAVAGEVQLLYDGYQYALKSDLLTAVPQYFLMDKDFDFGMLAQLARKNVWPDVWSILYETEKADEAWHNRMDELISPYLTDLAVWMQNYLTVTVEEENGQQMTRQYGRFPAEDMKNKMAQMIAAFYQDEALISHLKLVLTPSQQAAYLNRDMQSSFTALIQALQLNGQVIVDRKYDENGVSVLDSMELPMNGKTLHSLKIAITPENGRKAFHFSGLTAENLEFELEIIPSDEGKYQGKLQMEVMDKTSSEKKLRSLQFELAFSAKDEDYDLAQDLCTREYEGSLQVSVQDDDTVSSHDFTLTAHTKLASQSARAASTKIDSVWEIRDDMTGSRLGFAFRGKTVSPWTPMLITDIENTVPLTEKDAPETVSQWLLRLNQWMQDFLKLSVNP